MLGSGKRGKVWLRRIDALPCAVGAVGMPMMPALALLARVRARIRSGTFEDASSVMTPVCDAESAEVVEAALHSARAQTQAVPPCRRPHRC